MVWLKNIPNLELCCFYIPPCDSGRVWFHDGCLCVHQSVVHLSVFSFSDDNLSKYQWIFTKLGMFIDIVEIWFGIANEQILSGFDSYLLAPH